jgi:hypothetical protein
MAYYISGGVCARPCEGLEVPISNGTLTFYRGGPEGQREEIDDTQRELEEDGSFETVEIQEGQIEAGEPIVVVLELRNPCGGEGTVEVTLARTEFGSEGDERKYDWCLTPDQYCQLMEELGCRYVCGQITDCETGTPIPGLDVEMFDADIIQPDPLGTDTTDANGWYLIYYTQSAFEKTPAQWAPIELIGGPDLFFKISYGSNVLLDEDQSDGRQSDREDAGTCEHVDLCVDFEDPQGDPTAAAWIRVGQYTIPDSSGLNDFDPEGYTASGKYAFYRTLPLEGSIPVRNVPINGAGSNPIRYRFKVGDSQLKNGASGTASQFNQIVDDGNDLFSGVHVGSLVYLTSGGQFDVIQVRVEPSDLKSGGWVRLDEAITNAYSNASNTLAGLGAYKWSPSGKLAGLDTRQLTSETLPAESAVATGDPVPGSPPVDDETIAIKFELQERQNNTWQSMPGDGTTLNRIVVNNNTEFRKLGVVQLDADACQPVTTENVDLRYTLYHPHMEGAELEIQRGDQNAWNRIDDPSTELSFFNVSSTDGKYDHNYNDNLDISHHVSKSCSYIVRFRSRLRLTTGRSADGWSAELQSFCARDQ